MTALSAEAPVAASERALCRLSAFLRQELEAERDRWPLFVPVYLGTGGAFYFALPAWVVPWRAPAALRRSADAPHRPSRRAWRIAAPRAQRSRFELTRSCAKTEFSISASGQ
ncbi:MAG: hypothetical protein WAN51_03210 [Alphaproteobacteria bacterium]